MTRKRKWSIILLPVLAVAGTGTYFCFIHRYHLTKQKDGWYLDVSVRLVGCPVCSGHVERLEWSGRAIGFPTVIAADKRSENPWLNTPVGGFHLFPPSQEWKWYSTGPLRTQDIEERVSQEELSHGYYLMPPAIDEKGPGTPRKKGTPDHWCIISYENERFWVAPDKIGEIVLGSANAKKATVPALSDVRSATSSSPG